MALLAAAIHQLLVRRTPSHVDSTDRCPLSDKYKFLLVIRQRISNFEGFVSVQERHHPGYLHVSYSLGNFQFNSALVVTGRRRG
jgi:hypothetical protein